MIGKMAMATALRGFNDLGRSVAPTFRSRNRFYLQLVYLIGINAAEGENYTMGSWLHIFEAW